jgi:hypothetical protein
VIRETLDCSEELVMSPSQPSPAVIQSASILLIAPSLIAPLASSLNIVTAAILSTNQG